MEHKKLDKRAARLAGAEAGRQDDERLITLFAKEGIDDMKHTPCENCNPDGVYVELCKLHAAAPALVEALEACLTAQRIEEQGGDEYSMTMTDALDQARAAIKKTRDV